MTKLFPSSILNTDRRGSWGKVLKAFLFATTAIVFLSPRHLQADTPQGRMANLMVDEQGDQLILSCHFFYYLLPKQFLLHEMQDTPISLDVADPKLLQQNLTDLALVAFDLKVNGSNVKPTLLQLTPYANKSCLVVLSYPGRAGANVELRAPILQYFPPYYIIYVRLHTPIGSHGDFFGKDAPPVMHFVQYDKPLARPPDHPLFSKAFLAELGAAWINYNWILICAVLLFMQQPRQIIVLVAAIILGWILFLNASMALNFKLPLKIPEMALCFPTVLLCVISIKYPRRQVVFTLVTLAAGLLNAWYGIQQIPLKDPTQTVHALLGLSLGFVGGITLVLLALVPLWWECKKYPGFQESWAPRITWALAGLAVFLPLQKWLFG